MIELSINTAGGFCTAILPVMMLDLITSSDSKYKTAKVHSAAVVFFTGILHVKPLWMFKTIKQKKLTVC